MNSIRLVHLFPELDRIYNALITTWRHNNAHTKKVQVFVLFIGPMKWAQLNTIRNDYTKIFSKTLHKTLKFCTIKSKYHGT